MKAILLLALLLISSVTFAQSPGIKWIKCFGGTREDFAKSIDTTYDGGCIVMGQSTSSDGDLTGNKGGGDYWVIKLDSSGNIEWQKNLGGGGPDDGYSVQQTFDHGFIIAGSSTSNDADVSGNHGDNDIWVLLLDSLGNIKWQKCYGGTSNEYARCIKQTRDTGFIIAGWSQSTDGDVTGNHGIFDFWVIKIDSVGKITWQKSLGGSSWDYGYGVDQTYDGGYVVTGVTFSNDKDVSGNHGESDYWVVKLDSAGTIEWQKALGGTKPDEGRSIKQTRDSGYIVAGFARSNDGDISDNHGFTDYWVVKMNRTGAIEWAKSYGTSGDENAIYVEQTSEGGYVLAGDYSGTFGILKIDFAGNLEWQKLINGSSSDYATCVKETRDKGYVISAYTYSNDGDISANHGTWDVCVVRLEPDNILPVILSSFSVQLQNNEAIISWQTSMEKNTDHFNIQRSNDGIRFTNIATIKGAGNSDVPLNYNYRDLNLLNVITSQTIYYRLETVDKDDKFSRSNIINLNLHIETLIVKVWPNPVKDKLNIHTSNVEGELRVLIKNINGKEILNFIPNSINDFEIETSQFAAGVYFLTVRDDKENRLIKIIKQ